jgi:hypothetical protein
MLLELTGVPLCLALRLLPLCFVLGWVTPGRARRGEAWLHAVHRPGAAARNTLALSALTRSWSIKAQDGTHTFVAFVGTIYV